MSSDSKKEEKPLIHYRDGVDQGFASSLADFIYPLLKIYFRADLRGLDNLPKGNQFIIVSNHNGFLPMEVPFLFSIWWKNFGHKRKLLGLAHKIAFTFPVFKSFLPKIGAIYAHPDNAKKAIDEGNVLIVYPGGEAEALREIWDRKKIDFGNHKGFVKLALQKNTEIVPLVSFGGLDHFPLISNLRFLAQFLGLPRVLGIHHIPFTVQFTVFLAVTAYSFIYPVSIYWNIVSFLFIFLPLPFKMTLKFLPAIDPDEYVDIREEPEKSINRIYDVVTQRMQSELRKGHR